MSLSDPIQQRDMMRESADYWRGRASVAEAALADIKHYDEWSHNTAEWPGWNVWPYIRNAYTRALDSAQDAAQQHAEQADQSRWQMRKQSVLRRADQPCPHAEQAEEHDRKGRA